MPTEDTASAGGATSAAATTTPATPAATPPAATTPTATGEPAWLPERLARAREAAQRELLQSLGADSVDDAKARVAKAKELEESQKTETQRREERIRELEPQAKRASELELVLKGQAEASLSKLTPEQRTAVEALAGTDPAAQLRAVQSLAPTWAQAATATLAPPASTSAAGASPPAAGAAGAVDHKATWERLKGENPIAAANYLSAHLGSIFPAPTGR